MSLGKVEMENAFALNPFKSANLIGKKSIDQVESDADGESLKKNLRKSC